MAVKLSPVFNDAQLDSSGNPYVGAQLFTYAAGSTTKQTAYQDSGALAQHTNPIILNARGEPPAPIWLTEGSSYKLYLTTPTDSDPPVTSVRVIDNVRGVNDATVTIDEWVDSGLTPTYVSATSFTLAGDQTTEFHEGRRLKITDAGGTKYATITTSAYAALTTVTIAGDALASPTAAVSLGLLRANNPSVSSEMINRKGTAVASAATCDIWNTQGDFIHVTGNTGPITSFGTAPYTGAEKTIVFDSTPTITHNATSLILPGGANIVAAANDRMVIRADTTANMIVVSYTKATGKSVINTANTQQTRTVLTTGSGTYTTPTNATRLNIRMVGGGGGGGGATANDGTAGNDTTFSTLTAGGGGAGIAAGGVGGAGGTATNGDINIPGGSGEGGMVLNATGAQDAGGQGGHTAFGGGGGGRNNAAGRNGSTNSGGGGGGGGGSGGQPSGGGGGGGGYVEKLIVGPSASYSYGVGAAANGGAAGTFAGGNGAAGIIIVDEFYD